MEAEPKGYKEGQKKGSMEKQDCPFYTGCIWGQKKRQSRTRSPALGIVNNSKEHPQGITFPTVTAAFGTGARLEQSEDKKVA